MHDLHLSRLLVPSQRYQGVGRLEANPTQGVADYLRHKMEMSLEITAGIAVHHVQARENITQSSHSLATTEAGTLLHSQGGVYKYKWWGKWFQPRGTKATSP